MKSIMALCEKLAPPSLAYEKDNIGLIVGDPRARAKGVVVALDVTNEAIDMAMENGCNLIISHHPPIFYPVAKIDFSTPQGEILERLAKNGISVYSMHTNLDSAPKGLNHHVACLLGLDKPEGFASGGIIYRTGRLKRSMPAGDFAARVKKRLGLSSVRLYGKAEKPLSNIAVCTGSGGDMLSHAVANGADALVTGEVRHHNALECENLKAVVIEAGHAGTERPMVSLVSGYLKKNMAKTGKTVKILGLQVREPFENV